MCGFVAALSLSGARLPSEALKAMANSIAHRGPDDDGFFEQDGVSLGFRRLSILDLSPSGHQPMTSSCSRYTIVFNGEIYNYRELRAELQKQGAEFSSTGDTAVLLEAYKRWGPACLSRLNGMWALLIYDKVEKTVFGARDRFGIKPLFYHRSSQGWLFGSEAKVFKHSGWYAGGYNEATIAAYLQRNELDQTDASFYKDVLQLPPGHSFSIDSSGRMSTQCYWSLERNQQTILDPVGSFAELFEDAMALHMRSDVPVGVNLSGGLDSTSIICAAARINTGLGSDEPLMAFSYMDEKFDESNYIEATLKQTRAKLIRLNMSPTELWAGLDAVMAYQDEPVHSMSAVVGNQLMALAKSHGVKVLLNGQGADETLAGYPSYFRDYWADLIASGKLGSAWSQMSAFTAGHGGSTTSHMRAGLVRYFLGQVARLSFYKNLQAQRRINTSLNHQVVSAQLRREEYAAKIHPVVGLMGTLQSSVRRDPLPLYLRVEDRNSMQHSIEARVPFLDYRLVEFAQRCAESELLSGPLNKYLLRRAMTGKIPELVRTRVDKMGFPTSFSQWVRSWLFEEIRTLLGDMHGNAADWIDKGHAMKMLLEHRDGVADHATNIFNIVQIVKWTELQKIG